MASASGVSNRIGLSIFGILAARMRASRAGSPWTATGGTVPVDGTMNGVTVRSIGMLAILPLMR